jgi:DNA polymerase family B
MPPRTDACNVSMTGALRDEGAAEGGPGPGTPGGAGQPAESAQGAPLHGSVIATSMQHCRSLKLLQHVRSGLCCNQRHGCTLCQPLPDATDHARPGVRALATRLTYRHAGAQLCANALYGFTGAQTSMLQCLPLADSCLAMGAASTRRAVETIHELAADGAREAWDWRRHCNAVGADPVTFVTHTDRHT